MIDLLPVGKVLQCLKLPYDPKPLKTTSFETHPPPSIRRLDSREWKWPVNSGELTNNLLVRLPLSGRLFHNSLLGVKMFLLQLKCCILAFDPAKNAFPRWCTGRKWHILMAVIRGNRVGGNWLMKWDELKKFPWYTHRLTHRKRVTCELHDSYFRLMTIKHAISKIEWAIEWTLNYYITQSRQKSRQFEFQLQLEKEL